MSEPKMPETERLRALLNYDPETGALTWRVKKERGDIGSLATFPGSKGYLRVKVDRRLLMAHRVAWQIIYGTPPRWHIDHINGDCLDNRLANLRECTSVQNQWNAKPRNNRSGYRGVTARRGKWQARIRVNTKMIHLGTFDTPEAASTAYRAALERYAGDYAFHRREQAIRARFTSPAHPSDE